MSAGRRAGKPRTPSKQSDEAAKKSPRAGSALAGPRGSRRDFLQSPADTTDRYGVRRAAPSEPQLSGEELYARQKAQLLRAQEQVALIMSAMGRENKSGELVPLKRELAATQLQLAETEQLLDSLREELRAKASRERDIVSSTRALGHRTHEQRDYIAAIETQLTTTRTKLQDAESRIAEMMTFKRRSDQLTTQLGQERQRTRKKDEQVLQQRL